MPRLLSASLWSPAPLGILRFALASQLPHPPQIHPLRIDPICPPPLCPPGAPNRALLQCSDGGLLRWGRWLKVVGLLFPPQTRHPTAAPSMAVALRACYAQYTSLKTRHPTGHHARRLMLSVLLFFARTEPSSNAERVQWQQTYRAPVWLLPVHC